MLRDKPLIKSDKESPFVRVLENKGGSKDDQKQKSAMLSKFVYIDKCKKFNIMGLNSMDPDNQAQIQIQRKQRLN